MDSVQNANYERIERVTKKEKFYFYNTLSGVLKGLEGEYTIVDLQNEGCISGKVKYVDGFMNIDFEDAIFYDSRGVEHYFEKFFIKGRLIRYVHIPKHISTIDTFEKCVNGLRGTRIKKPSFTFKVSRAKKYHKETVDQAFGNTKNTSE